MSTFASLTLAMLVTCRVTGATPLIDKEELCVAADHYLSYPLDSLASLSNLDDVTLIDELMASPDVFTIVDANRLLNPATKWHNGKKIAPKRPNTHYVALSIEPVDGIFDFSDISSVLVSNQFGARTFNIPGDLLLGDDGNPNLELLLPSVKKACPGERCVTDTLDCDDCFPDGDTYLCYELDVSDSLPVRAIFKDQFTQRNVDGLVPQRLCNPVSLLPNGTIAPLANDESNHLLCYEVSSKTIPSKLVNLLNRFGIQRGVVRINDGVCVPSSEVVIGTCGNGVVEAGEQCDDANQIPFDGCESNCVLSFDCDASDPNFGFIQGTPRYVDPNGNDTTDCINKFNPCSTIAYAIAQAMPGDTIVLAADTFPEANLVVSKNLFIFGQGPAASIVDATGQNQRVFTVSATIEATFCGLQITGGVTATGGDGGGIFNNGITNIINSNISSNTADIVLGDGGGIFSNGTLNITNSTISDNAASGGGGIYIPNGGTVNIISSNISGNTANIGGGILSNGNGTITNSTITSNTGDFVGAGGIYNSGFIAITNSTISANIANSGGGLINDGTIDLINSTINGNMADSTGGGIDNRFGEIISIINSTISGNTATQGGGINNNLGTINIANSTISDNTAIDGGGIFNFAFNTVTATHTIVANSLSGSDCNGPVIDSGFNLEEDNSCGFATINEDPILGPLQDNGGPTFTHALLVNSPAIDTGAATCGVGTDQRGEQRPVNGFCDIGSFEVQ